MADSRAKNREARIEVVPVGASLEVRLIDVSGGDAVLAQSPVGDAFENGFPDLLLGDKALTAQSLIESYGKEAGLANRTLFGKYLYRLLTPGDVGTAWKKCRQNCDDEDLWLTTLLELPAGWEALPWELLYETQHLFTHKRHSMGLRIAGGKAKKAAGCHWPLRMLVIVGCAENDTKIKWKEELLAIRRAIAAFSLRIELTVEKTPTSIPRVSDLITRLRPHFLHFIGHGTVKNGGTLYLSDAVGANPWIRDDLANTLSDLNREVPRLAFINACQSAGVEGSLGDTSVAEAFSNIGCPAAVAMRGDIPGDAASVFAGSFYQALALLGVDQVDRAYSHALGEVASRGFEKRDWSQPRIFYQQTAGQVFPLGGDCRGFHEQVKELPELKELRPFVDREDERSVLFHQLDCWLAPEAKKRSLLIVGDPRTGKTWLLKAIVYVASLRRLRACYRSFKDLGHQELEDFLRTLREGAPGADPFFSGPLVAAGAPANPFAEFDSGPSASGLSGNEDHKRPLAERFARGLKAAAENTPLLVAFDHIDKLNTCWTFVRETLFVAAARGSAEGGLGANLRFAIAASPDEVAQFGLGSLGAETVVLGSLKPEAFDHYALQYCLHLIWSNAEFSENLEKCTEMIELTKRNRIKGKDWKLDLLPPMFEWTGVES